MASRSKDNKKEKKLFFSKKEFVFNFISLVVIICIGIYFVCNRASKQITNQQTTITRSIVILSFGGMLHTSFLFFV